MLCRPLRMRACTCCLLVALAGIGLWQQARPAPAWGQLQTLSAGNADQQWREAQLQAFDSQLADAKLPEELKRELAAQRAWLVAWEPQSRRAAASSATDPADASRADTRDADSEPADPSSGKAAENDPLTDAAKAQNPQQNGDNAQEAKDDDSAKEPAALAEPVIDPDDMTKELRARLFDPERPATTADTQALQTALMKHSGDVGLRQLQLHWIDQPTYRDVHWQEIGNSADRVLALLSDLPASEETKAAAAFANYRKARALAHALRGRPLRNKKIAGIDKLRDADREQMQNAIGECWRQIETLVGAGRPEFFQLEVYNLRRYGWNGQALELLERHASAVNAVAYLGERQSILEALGWTAPAQQTAAALVRAKKAAGEDEAKRTFEIQFVPLKAS